MNTYMKWLVGLMLGVGILGFPLPGQARPPFQGREPIRYGEAVTRRIEANASHQFEFEGQAGDWLLTTQELTIYAEPDSASTRITRLPAGLKVRPTREPVAGENCAILCM